MTSTDSLVNFFTTNFNTSKSEVQNILKYFKHTKALKNEVLVKEGQVCHHLFFVVKGCLKASFEDHKGQESIRYLAFENQFISNLYSFIKQTDTSEYISAIEASDLFVISYNHFSEALNLFPFFKDFYIRMLEETYFFHQWRIETLLKLDAKRRYEYILKNNTQLVHRLSNKNLASFLGITQESLSRIKTQI